MLMALLSALAPAETRAGLDFLTSAFAEAPVAFSGSMFQILGYQEAQPDSIYDVAGSTQQPSLATSQTDITLYVARPGRFNALMDVQRYEQPSTDTATQYQVNQFNLAFNISDAVKLRLGKQRVMWGYGLAYIPTDFINPPLDPRGQDLAKVGVSAISADYVTDYYALTGIVLSKGAGDSHGLKVTSSVRSGLDLIGVWYRAPNVGNAVGASFSADASILLSEHLKGLVVSGGVGVNQKSRYPSLVSTTIGNFTFLQPGPVGQAGVYTSWMAAATYDVNDRFSLSTEVYHIGDAYSRNDYRNILQCLSDHFGLCRGSSSAWLNYLAYGRNQRNYQTFSAALSGVTAGEQRFSDTLSLRASILRGGGDGSALYTVEVTSNYWDRMEITWRNFIPMGGNTTEFGTMPYRWYFDLLIKISF